MAGTFSHITAVSCVCGGDDVKKLSTESFQALTYYSPCCELGAVSPDLPYLRIGSRSGKFWANTMHHDTTANFVRAAIPIVLTVSPKALRLQCVSWLFGFTSHLVADMTLHPVIELKVGPYEQNKTQHRLCEMNQDVYIFNHLLHQDVRNAELLDTGIGLCKQYGQFIPTLSTIWSKIFTVLNVAYGGRAPDIKSWYTMFEAIHDKVAEEGAYIPFSRHFTDKLAMTYPDVTDVDQDFIHSLATPEKTVLHFETIFQRILDNIICTWHQLDRALVENQPILFTLPNGDLDTGLAAGQSVFWKNTL